MLSQTKNLSDPVSFVRGPTMKNRFMLAPLTNWQSHTDGTLSDDEYRWLTMRARGGFGLTMTCASHVQASGQGFPGQLGDQAASRMGAQRVLSTSPEFTIASYLTGLHYKEDAHREHHRVALVAAGLPA